MSKPPGEYASAPCYLHELEPTTVGPQSWEEIRLWRKQTRGTLIAQRLALASHVRTLRGQQAKQRLAESVDLGQYGTLGIYWPMRGEIDARDIARRHLEAGGVVGLPVVVERGAPVEFWEWRPGTKLQRGIWEIPIPAERNVVCPDALVIPLVGFDERGYRLGYGGGYYDRTLAVAASRPFCVGLGYADAHLPTIHPQPHDIPMNLIVTDRVVVRVNAVS
jgi:5-formyltetrahydrofolate cyclo-ligase